MATKIWFVAGISGGHIIPCLTMAQQLKKDFPKCKILFFSTNTPTDHAILEKNELIDTHVTLPLRRVPWSIAQYPRFIAHTVVSFLYSFYHLMRQRPDKIVSTGGLISIPVCFAAWILRIPIELYELNAIPGKALIKLAPLATRIFYCFDGTKNYLAQPFAERIAYPLRHTKQDKAYLQTDACKELGLNPLKKTICILGGSQGSLFLNNFIKEWATTNTAEDIQIIHQTGPDSNTNWHAFYQDLGVSAYVFSFKRDIARCYQAADLIICRAGAGTIFEVAFFEKPCILIPLETSSTSHQIDNAYEISKEFPRQFAVLEQDVAQKNKRFAYTLITSMLSVSQKIKSHQNELGSINNSYQQ